jgi:kanamycin kinase
VTRITVALVQNRRVNAGFGSAGTTIPAIVEQLAAGQQIRVAWDNEMGGITCEFGEGADRRFVKWSPTSAIDLEPEVARLQWAIGYTPVPEVCAFGRDDSATWIVTLACPGENAVTPKWKARPDVATRAIGEGLRAFHDRLPVASCPFSWSAEERIDDARRRAALGLINPSGWHEAHRHLSIEDALRRLAHPPEVEQLVVCHGDTCAPNILIGDDGEWTAHVDLGSLGMADRWADLAIATWSTQWNYGEGWEERVLASYGVDPDPERTAYYRLLWDLGP